MEEGCVSSIDQRSMAFKTMTCTMWNKPGCSTGSSWTICMSSSPTSERIKTDEGQKSDHIDGCLSSRWNHSATIDGWKSKGTNMLWTLSQKAIAYGLYKSKGSDTNVTNLWHMKLTIFQTQLHSDFLPDKNQGQTVSMFEWQNHPQKKKYCYIS